MLAVGAVSCSDGEPVLLRLPSPSLESPGGCNSKEPGSPWAPGELGFARVGLLIFLILNTQFFLLRRGNVYLCHPQTKLRIKILCVSVSDVEVAYNMQYTLPGALTCLGQFLTDLKLLLSAWRIPAC